MGRITLVLLIFFSRFYIFEKVKMGIKSLFIISMTQKNAINFNSFSYKIIARNYSILYSKTHGGYCSSISFNVCVLKQQRKLWCFCQWKVLFCLKSNNFQEIPDDLLIGTPLFSCPGHFSSVFEKRTAYVIFPSKNVKNAWSNLPNKRLVIMDCLKCE